MRGWLAGILSWFTSGDSEPSGMPLLLETIESEATGITPDFINSMLAATAPIDQYERLREWVDTHAETSSFTPLAIFRD